MVVWFIHRYVSHGFLKVTLKECLLNYKNSKENRLFASISRLADVL